ncbi:FMN-dependent L-lactate dehydrogenase LldD [Asticcacaulis benevestitus]|nr:FMN-dependent L-lactate dehydrogenase LldD [Asticcacaulis benevestitus]
MIISASTDFREAARRRLPPFLFHYLDGGAYAEHTLRANIEDLGHIRLRQRVLRDVSAISMQTQLLGDACNLPLALAPIGLGGMFARRGETQVARAARKAGIPYIVSTVSLCPLEEIVAASQGGDIWFQLYVLKDRGFMKAMLERALALGVSKLVFTVDMPAPGARYRDRHSGMSGDGAGLRRIWQAIRKPGWAFDVGLMGQPHDLGNVSAYLGRHISLEDYIGWLGENFDPSVDWKDLEWIRSFWPGKMIIKGILDKEDALDAVRFGADGIVVSNHGGRQLDSVPSSAYALPDIAEAVDRRLVVLADSGVRTGLDVLKLLALGAQGVLLGRAYIYALAAGGGGGVTHLLDLIERELRTAMTLSGVTALADVTPDMLVWR